MDFDTNDDTSEETSDDTTASADDSSGLPNSLGDCENLVVDLRALKDAQRMADLHFQVNGVRSSPKEVLEYALSLQLHHKSTGRYS